MHTYIHAYMKGMYIYFLFLYMYTYFDISHGYCPVDCYASVSVAFIIVSVHASSRSIIYEGPDMVARPAALISQWEAPKKTLPGYMGVVAWAFSLIGLSKH